MLQIQHFEVASVKPSSGGRVAMTSVPGRISYSNVPLKRILLSAYDVKDYQLVGPDWLNTLRFDIAAKVPESATKEQIQSMWQDLLASRFQMKLHRETKVLPIYALVLGKNGAKMKPTSTGSPDAEQLAGIRRDEGKDGFPVLALQPGALIIETRGGRGRISAKDVPMAKLADLLSGQVGRPVLDSTGLAGNYSFTLYFTPESSDAGSEPYLFTALQEQLGLRLEARKGPVELLVVDRAEKTPTAN